MNDFVEISPVEVLRQLFEVRPIPPARMSSTRRNSVHLQAVQTQWSRARHTRILRNLCVYMQLAPTDAYFGQWSTLVPFVDAFFRRYANEVTRVSTAVATNLWRFLAAGD